MHKLKEFERSLFQIPMEIERVKIGRSGRNHGMMAKPGSASSSENFIEGSRDETEILDEARRFCALKNLANLIGKELNICAIASQIMEYSSESCLILLNSSQHFP
jgi:hypothetical protein